jgi:uncharacterized protein (DUF1778 family)
MSSDLRRDIGLTCPSPGNTLATMSESTSKRKHSTSLYIRVTPEHEELVKKAAELAGTSLSDWIRDRLTRVARREIAEAARYEAAGKAQE